MFRNATIRFALTLTIAGYTAALMLVIATSIAGLETANTALDRMYSEETAALRHLTASSEALLQVRVDLGAYETLVAQGKPTDAVLARVHAEQTASDRGLADHMSQPPSNDAGKALAGALRAKRAQLTRQVISPEIAALDQNDFVSFRTTQRQAPDTLFGDCRRAVAHSDTAAICCNQSRYGLRAFAYTHALPARKNYSYSSSAGDGRLLKRG